MYTRDKLKEHTVLELRKVARKLDAVQTNQDGTTKNKSALITSILKQQDKKKGKNGKKGKK